MIKKNLKLFTILLIILAVISSFSLCFAEETNDEATNTETSEVKNNESTDENIHEGDLYLFDSKVEMNQLVDGNVYIIGNNIKVSGQVNGNLFVFGDTVNFDNCYVRYSIYACANNIYYNGACNDLYASSNKLEMTYDSYVVRDVKAVTNKTILKAAIGRDIDLKTSSVDFGSDEEIPIIYGDLRYSANEEKTLADGIVEGNVTYSSNSMTSSNQSVGENILDIVLAFLGVIVTALIIYALFAKFKPEYIKRLSTTSPVEILKAIGIGLLTIVFGIIATVILLITSIGAKLAFILAFLLVLIGLFATPIVAIFITNLLKPVLKIEKAVIYYVVLALVAIVLYGLTFVPFYIGSVISFIIFVLGYGLIVSSVLPKKELSEEDIQKKLADKEAKKTLKAEKKAEKAKLKESKKNTEK